MTTRPERTFLLNADDETLWDECENDFRRASGHGGQKINKTSSAVRVYHAQTGIAASSMESRSQHVNRIIALKKLRFRIACQERCEPDPDFRVEPAPSVQNKNYPVWIAALFDALAASAWDLDKAAGTLGISRGRLTRLLRKDDSLWREFLRASGGRRNTGNQHTNPSPEPIS